MRVATESNSFLKCCTEVFKILCLQGARGIHIVRCSIQYNTCVTCTIDDVPPSSKLRNLDLDFFFQINQRCCRPSMMVSRSIVFSYHSLMGCLVAPLRLVPLMIGSGDTFFSTGTLTTSSSFGFSPDMPPIFPGEDVFEISWVVLTRCLLIG